VCLLFVCLCYTLHHVERELQRIKLELEAKERELAEAVRALEEAYDDLSRKMTEAEEV
jgi:hypothetical protein